MQASLEICFRRTPSPVRTAELILESGSEFKASGLKRDSLIRPGFLATIPQNNLQGILGAIPPEKLRLLKERLTHHISRNSK